MKKGLLFEEKQYLGFNKPALMRNLVFVLFCFIAYYWTEEREVNGDLFFLVGCSILVLAIVFLFVKHLHTKVFADHMELDGIWTTRKVKIDFGSIVKCEKTAYSPYFINNPAYNLHIKGVIRFYTSGRFAVRMVDKTGLEYLVGSQRADELCKVVNERMVGNEGGS
jgi:hypothetical protein